MNYEFDPESLLRMIGGNISSEDRNPHRNSAEWILQPEQEKRLFRPLVGQITYSPTRVMPEGVTSIDLETFSGHAEGLIERSLQDPQGLERARSVYATFGGKIIISTEDILGKKRPGGQTVETPIFTPIRRDINIKERLFVTLMHSHGAKNYPPSPIDCEPLFLSGKDTYALTTVFVVTAEKIFMIFRGVHSPVLSSDQAQSVQAQWNATIQTGSLDSLLDFSRSNQGRQQLFQERLLQQYAKKFSWKVFISTDFETAHLVE